MSFINWHAQLILLKPPLPLFFWLLVPLNLQLNLFIQFHSFSCEVVFYSYGLSLTCLSAVFNLFVTPHYILYDFSDPYYILIFGSLTLLLPFSFVFFFLPSAVIHLLALFLSAYSQNEICTWFKYFFWICLFICSFAFYKMNHPWFSSFLHVDHN